MRVGWDRMKRKNKGRNQRTKKIELGTRICSERFSSLKREIKSRITRAADDSGENFFVPSFLLLSVTTASFIFSPASDFVSSSCSSGGRLAAGGLRHLPSILLLSCHFFLSSSSGSFCSLVISDRSFFPVQDPSRHDAASIVRPQLGSHPLVIILRLHHQHHLSCVWTMIAWKERTMGRRGGFQVLVRSTCFCC